MSKSARLRNAAAQAQAARERAARAARHRRRVVFAWGGAGGAAVAVAVTLAVVLVGPGASVTEVMPPAVAGGRPDVQPAALAVANTSGVAGVVAYDTTGWPATSRNGPTAQALRHGHVSGPVT